MNRLDIIFVIIGIGVSVLIVSAIMSATDQTNLAMETIKLAKGKITIFQVRSHIGKAAVDNENCRQFNLLYGPQP